MGQEVARDRDAPAPAVFDPSVLYLTKKARQHSFEMPPVARIAWLAERTAPAEQKPAAIVEPEIEKQFARVR
jgi:hypothetical protein